MESLRSDAVMMSGNAPLGGGGYGYGDNGLTSGLLLAGLLGGGLGGNRYQGPGLVEASALYNQQAIGETRRDVKDSESEIRETLHLNTLSNHSEFRALDREISLLGRESLASGYEGKLATKDMTFDLLNKVDRETDSLRRQNFNDKVDTDKQFSILRQDMFNGLAAIEKREMQREIDSLRGARNEDRMNNIERVLRKIVENTEAS
jgi:hypothetical protein